MDLTKYVYVLLHLATNSALTIFCLFTQKLKEQEKMADELTALSATLKETEEGL